MLPDFKTRAPPPLLYRYSSAKRVRDFVTDPHLRFSSPATFNDPFEFRPEFKIRARGTALAELLRHNKISPRASTEQAQSILARRIHDDAASRYHVLCFAEDPLHPLMWAHYAGSHSGFVLGFDSELFTPFRMIGQPAGPVHYYPARPIIEYPSAVGEEADTIDAIFTKGTDWAYEREWRIALLRKDDVAPSEQRPMNFDPSLLRVVIAGARCTQEDYDAILAGLKAAQHFRHVELFRVSAEEHGFRFRLTRKDRSACSLDRFVQKFSRERERRRASGQTWYAESMQRRAEKVARRDVAH